VKIVHVNSSSSGGAYRAAVGLHKGLLDLSVNSTFFTQGSIQGDHFVRFQKKSENQAVSFFNKLHFKSIIRERSRYRFERFGKPSYFEDPVVIWGPATASEFPPADVFHLHDLKQFIDYQTFFGKVASKHSMVWTLHDMTPFTGGCDYDYHCGRFQENCGRCPALSSSCEQDLSRKNLKIKTALFENLDPALVKIVAPSEWLSREARKSKAFGRFDTSVIPYGINTEDFAPREKQSVRAALGIAPDEFVMLVLSSNLDDHRKGLHLLAGTLHGLDPSVKFTMLYAGHGRAVPIPAVRMVHAGGFSNDRMLSLIYSAADVFVLPSLADNLPNVAIESLACGTPVVAFDVGGIPDIIEHEKTGLLARTGDVAQLRKHLDRLSKERRVLRSMSENCRQAALRKFSSRRQAEAYLAIYKQLFQRTGAVPAAN
jgi:glycosyltransferase involved in cell wall biosynthesis